MDDDPLVNMTAFNFDNSISLVINKAMKQLYNYVFCNTESSYITLIQSQFCTGNQNTIVGTL